MVYWMHCITSVFCCLSNVVIQSPPSAARGELKWQDSSPRAWTFDPYSSYKKIASMFIMLAFMFIILSLLDQAKSFEC